MDATCIKKHLSFLAIVTLADLQIEGLGTAATEALVFMLVSLTGKWKNQLNFPKLSKHSV